jgi:hypothetical protein
MPIRQTVTSYFKWAANELWRKLRNAPEQNNHAGPLLDVEASPKQLHHDSLVDSSDSKFSGCFIILAKIIECLYSHEYYSDLNSIFGDILSKKFPRSAPGIPSIITLLLVYKYAYAEILHNQYVPSQAIDKHRQLACGNQAFEVIQQVRIAA